MTETPLVHKEMFAMAVPSDMIILFISPSKVYRKRNKYLTNN